LSYQISGFSCELASCSSAITRTPFGHIAAMICQEEEALLSELLYSGNIV